MEKEPVAEQFANSLADSNTGDVMVVGDHRAIRQGGNRIKRRPNPRPEMHLPVLRTQAMGRGSIQESARADGKLHQKINRPSG